jgi:hypothetical protein
MLLTTGQPGVVHLYVGGRLIAIHANQSGGECRTSPDAAPPERAVPTYFFSAEISRSVPGPDGVRYYRRIVRLEFGDAATDEEIAGVLRSTATVVLSGGPPSRAYLVRVRGSGSSWEAFEAMRARLAEAPGVVDVVPIAVRRP